MIRIIRTISKILFSQRPQSTSYLVDANDDENDDNDDDDNDDGHDDDHDDEMMINIMITKKMIQMKMKMMMSTMKMMKMRMKMVLTWSTSYLVDPPSSQSLGRASPRSFGNIFF